MTNSKYAKVYHLAWIFLKFMNILNILFSGFEIQEFLLYRGFLFQNLWSGKYIHCSTLKWMIVLAFYVQIRLYWDNETDENKTIINISVKSWKFTYT